MRGLGRSGQFISTIGMIEEFIALAEPLWQSGCLLPISQLTAADGRESYNSFSEHRSRTFCGSGDYSFK